MSQSQSRYSIVERLTSTKLALISKRNAFVEEIEDAEQIITEMRKNLDYWKEDIKIEVEREERDREKKISIEESKLEFLKSQKEPRQKVVNEKLDEINKALKAIENISESASKET